MDFETYGIKNQEVLLIGYSANQLRKYACFIADTFSSLTPSRLTFTCPVSCTIFDLRGQSVTDSGFRH